MPLLRQLAIEDHLLRLIYKKISTLKNQVTGSGRSGEIEVQPPSQKIILRSGVKIMDDSVTLILFAGLPGIKRSVLAKECVRLFSELVPSIWGETLTTKSLDSNQVEESIKTLEDYFALRENLDKNGWTA